MSAHDPLSARPSPCDAPSLYGGVRDQSGVPVVFGPKVKSWPGWPDDVRGWLRAWNRSGDLSFVYKRLLFKCPDCERFIDPGGTAACRLDGTYICDDCIVQRVRATWPT